MKSVRVPCAHQTWGRSTPTNRPRATLRDTAQRLLVERSDNAAQPLLENLLRTSPKMEARLHALYTLDGLGSLTPSLIELAVQDVEPRVQEHAIKLGGERLSKLAEKTERYCTVAQTLIQPPPIEVDLRRPAG